MTQDPRLILDAKEAFAYYEGNLSGFPRLLVGRLMLTKNFLAFHQYDVEKAGLLERARLRQTGNIISIPLDKIVSVSVEQGVRASKSKPNWKNADDFLKKSIGERPLNIKPRLLDSAERYARLVVTIETDYGVEVAYFEVDDSTKWAGVISARIRKHTTTG